MSTTSVSDSPGKRYLFPDDSTVLGKVVDDLHVMEEDVEQDLEETTDEGGGREMEFLEKTSAETARKKLIEDPLCSPVSKAPHKSVEQFLGTYANESPAISQQKHIPSSNYPSTMTSADQVPLASQLIPPVVPSESSMNESPTTSVQKHTRPADCPASSPIVDKVFSMDFHLIHAFQRVLLWQNFQKKTSTSMS
ncbi:hypothetical protein ACH5RR_029044 [Cinchona calisaya]|uniref:Uncharacterized protein n=1 Tax=Cinchona calisaya TaxID=153742 RepID=A0ABD2YVS8_9GENT